MSYLKALQYLESRINYEKLSKYPYKKALSLKRVQFFLDTIHNPESFLKSIHIAGTKGKGSTSAFIAYILREAGYRVGLYTSPHLVDFRERIRILAPGSAEKEDFSGMIPKRKFAELVFRLRPTIEKYNRVSKYGPLTYFEICTIIALVYFKEEHVDFAVLETGLGGRLDATNAVNPLASIITPISYEHMDKLGYTLTKIASEKAGIIKSQKSPPVRQTGKVKSQKSTVISAPQTQEALTVIRSKCKKEKAKLLVVGRNIKYAGTENNFKVITPCREYKNLKIKLIGAHQIMNAAVSLGAIESLRSSGVKVSIDSIRGGLYNTLWPGRCEIVSKRPFIILDGAQNSASAGVLSQAVRNRFRYQRLILVLGISSDKDMQGIAKQLYALADAVILTQARTPRAADAHVLKNYFKGKETYVTESVREAKKLALKISRKEDLILITGSLFVVGEFRNDKS